MKPIQNPPPPAIGPESSGEVVANLQDALLFLLERERLQLSAEGRADLRQERREQRYSHGTIRAVTAFREQFGLDSVEVVDEPMAEVLNGLLQELGALATFVVRGQLVDAHGRTLPNYTVILSEYDLDEITEISTDRSKEDGTFAFAVNNSDPLRQGDSDTDPDLLLQVNDPDGREQWLVSITILEDGLETAVPRLAESEQAPIVLMNVVADLLLRVVVNADRRLPTEFELLVIRLSPFMRKIDFADLKEDEEHFQISFLNRETGIAKEKIEGLRDAFQHQRESAGVPAWAFFGLAGQGVSLAVVASLPIEPLVSSLQALQPAADESDLEEIARQLLQFLKERAIQTQISTLATSVGEIIQPVLGSDEKLRGFLDAYARHEGDATSFWAKMSEEPDLHAHLPAIQLNLQLAQLTANNLGLSQGLQALGITNTRQLVDVSDETWGALALEHKAGIPAHVLGDEATRVRTYAQELQMLVELAFPTDVIKKHVQAAEVHTFLNNNPDFDFTCTPVETYLLAQGEAAFAGIEHSDEVKAQLRKIQRLYTVTANVADMNVLIDKQYESAQQIARLSAEDFARGLADKISLENAYAYHAKAVAISDTSAMIYHQLRDLTVAPAFAAVQNLRGDPHGAQAIPNWELLFGSLDMCACEHCQSVYSPAAYFVDLLHILLGKNDGAARKEIFRRRPDLRYTKLSCEHTEVLIPYIDLVNEILETYVAQSHVGDDKAREHAEISTNDTSAFTSAELAANPQHPNTTAHDDAKNAYALLADAKFPLNLPFDMNLESARQFLRKQNSSRFEVMQTFGEPDKYATRAEGLGISPQEFEILTFKQVDGVTSAGIDPVKDLWGNPALPAGQTLGKVDDFLERASITYTDLLNLLHTRFLNEFFPINVYLHELSPDDRTVWLAAHPEEARLALTVIELDVDKADPCNLSKTQLRHLNGAFLSDDELSRFNRFIRLWKKLGCTIQELDGLLMALKAEDITPQDIDITPQVIQDLSIAWQIQRRLHLSLDRVAVLIGDMPTAGKDSLFAKLFLNKAMLQIDPKFQLNVEQSELENSSVSLANHIPAILAACKISEEDLHQIAELAGLNLAADHLNVKNLSTLYRYVVFAKALRMKIKDLVTWFKLMSLSPWTTTSDLLNAQELLAKVQTYGFKAADFVYIFQNERATGHALPPNDEIINQSATTLREGLQKVRQENTAKDGQVTADFLKNALGTILEAEEVTKIIGILNGSNETDPFENLRTPKVADNYKSILQDYLTSANVDALKAEKDSPKRFHIYWDKIEAKLLPVLQETFVQQHLIAAFKIEAAIVKRLLQESTLMQACLAIETDSSEAAREEYAKQYLAVHKFAWLVEKLQLTGKELDHFEKNSSNFDGFHWNNFDLKIWLHIADYVALRDSLPLAEKDLLSVFEVAGSNNIADVVTAIVDVTDWNEANVQYFVTNYPPTFFPADFQNEIALLTLQRQTALSGKIGVSFEKLESWTTDFVDDANALDLKRTLKAKYDEDAWIAISTEIHNHLRTQLRDALLAYLLQKAELKALNLKSANDLYAYFLIDVEMEACMQTSRLKQAIASVQLFVQRCLLNLEAKNQITPNMIDANQWKWMKNYRVWEANRKVFLYPENWIEPELRDNKSPFFKELESELLQVEITNESAEQKLMNYLEKLDEVARLDICGIYEDQEAQELHVFGRAFNTPPQYFYRKLNLKNQVWTAWERVPLDIQGNEEGESAGVHLMPVVWNRRLYLFWPIFAEKSDKEKIQQDKEKNKRWKEDLANFEAETRRNETTALAYSLKAKPEDPPIGVTTNPTPPGPEPEIYPWAYYEVRIAWSEYRQNKWSNKRISQSFVRTPSEQVGVWQTWRYRFSLHRNENLTIRLSWSFEGVVAIPVGQFSFNCNGKINAVSEAKQPSLLPVITPKQTFFYQSFLSANCGILRIFWHQDQSLPFGLVINGGKNTHDILNGSEKEYKILFPADHTYSKFSTPNFIYQDHKRAYYVEYDYYWSIIVPGITDGTLIDIPRVDREALPKITDGIHPPPLERLNRFEQLSPVILDQLVDEQQLSTTTAMQILSTQAFDTNNVNVLARNDFSSPIAKVGARYLASPATSDRTLKFKPFFHAYVCKFMEALNKDGIDGLLTLQNQQFTDFAPLLIPDAAGQWQFTFINNFTFRYRPHELNVTKPYPMEDVDFSPDGAYSLYNWELFFHVPMLIANRLSKNQRFEEAMRWYHFVFNPTTSDTTTNDTLNPSARFWQVIPFRNTPKETLDSLMKQLQNKAGDPDRKRMEDTIAAWRNNPFNPHLIARMRLVAYQKNAVMKYLDNLIAWGDYLFRQDTIESINQATQLYILAAEICGKRPEKIPALGKNEALTYAELEKKGLDAFSNALRLIETTFPFFNFQAVQPGLQGTAALFNTTVKEWYFCLPDNDKLMGYWDTIADRLFKIRHCQNIEGIERQLALFEPPIDPALLVRAVAGGVDISSVLADLNSPLPYYRFSYILQKALEICSQLQSLGSSLLSVLEKKDAEALSMMRSQHETMVLNLAKTVRKLQITEAQRNREGLEKSRDVVDLRAEFYTQLVQEGLNSGEKEHETLSTISMGLSVAGQALEMAASSATPIPDAFYGSLIGPFGGAIGLVNVGGGTKGGAALSAVARFFQMLSTVTTWAANAAQTNAGYQRRAKDWELQRDLAKKDLVQIDKQILAFEIREQIAEQEMSNHEQQLENARQIEEFLRNKYTQEELYGWMIGEISTIYFQCYQLAYDLAKKAEKAYRYELGLPTSSFIQFGIWDSFRKGLLSGERLYLSLKQMEKSYMDQNRREYELTKHVSLLHLNSLELIKLRETGSCTIHLPKWLFDSDYPGHYMRRIKSVSLTIPCIVGPYTSVNGTLTLLKSKTRMSAINTGEYAEDDDPEVVTNFAATESIATSSAQNDSGMFELNFRDERYLPFEGEGAISDWRLELSGKWKDSDDETVELPQFDFNTISDVVLHLRYTAREGGAALKKAAVSALKETFAPVEGDSPLMRLFSLRHEFPSEWYRLQNVADELGNHKQAFSLDKGRFPFPYQGAKWQINVKGVDLFGAPKEPDIIPELRLTLTSPEETDITLGAPDKVGLLVHKGANTDIEVKNLGDDRNEADWTIAVTAADKVACLDRLEDILVLCHYSVTSA